MASLGLGEPGVGVQVIKHSSEKEGLFSLREGNFRIEWFLGYSEIIGEEFLKDEKVFANDLMIELSPSIQPISSNNKEKAQHHIDSALMEIEIPLGMTLFDSFI